LVVVVPGRFLRTRCQETLRLSSTLPVTVVVVEVFTQAMLVATEAPVVVALRLLVLAVQAPQSRVSTALLLPVVMAVVVVVLGLRLPLGTVETA
jgi:hypothetical protein